MRRSALLAFWLSAILAGCSAEDTSQPDAVQIVEPAPASASLSAALIGKAQQLLRAEPQVVDLVHDPAAVYQWTVGVRPDGSQRSGFAEYLCMVLSDAGIDTAGQRIRVVDYRAYVRLQGDARQASLGSFDCGTGQAAMP